MLWPIGAFPDPQRSKFMVTTPPILGHSWELELIKVVLKGVLAMSKYVCSWMRNSHVWLSRSQRASAVSHHCSKTREQLATRRCSRFKHSQTPSRCPAAAPYPSEFLSAHSDDICHLRPPCVLIDTIFCVRNVTAPASWHTINIYEFGINRQLCTDPSLRERHKQHSILYPTATK